ncbi:Hypothetical protein ORPV_876 [Orpheovirus IHUMI-LCC2]|uniref:Uncharacterized protein n=1 Tax=Orpheovirus IHUMI-LCC2 TaxID=2023057 RepID=A0A2I2L5K7_9VIRU|nr:Hypothetical protein ORPV_876 [Orpheovirus IHUMI-LCC2]SNW62780.1 Hypothetical protein ORPV_876 [Orpheovirus IHUMI-LCC2]
MYKMSRYQDTYDLYSNEQFVPCSNIYIKYYTNTNNKDTLSYLEREFNDKFHIYNNDSTISNENDVLIGLDNNLNYVIYYNICSNNRINDIFRNTREATRDKIIRVANQMSRLIHNTEVVILDNINIGLQAYNMNLRIKRKNNLMYDNGVINLSYQ